MKRCILLLSLCLVWSAPSYAVHIDYKGKRYEINDFDDRVDSVNYCVFHAAVARVLGKRKRDFYIQPTKFSASIYDTNTTMLGNRIDGNTIVFVVDDKLGQGMCDG